MLSRLECESAPVCQKLENVYVNTLNSPGNCKWEQPQQEEQITIMG